MQEGGKIAGQPLVLHYEAAPLHQLCLQKYPISPEKKKHKLKSGKICGKVILYCHLIICMKLGSDEDKSHNRKKNKIHCHCGELMGGKASRFGSYFIAPISGIYIVKTRYHDN